MPVLEYSPKPRPAQVMKAAKMMKSLNPTEAPAVTRPSGKS